MTLCIVCVCRCERGREIENVRLFPREYFISWIIQIDIFRFFVTVTINSNHSPTTKKFVLSFFVFICVSSRFILYFHCVSVLIHTQSKLRAPIHNELEIISTYRMGQPSKSFPLWIFPVVCGFAFFLSALVDWYQTKWRHIVDSITSRESRLATWETKTMLILRSSDNSKSWQTNNY